MGMLAVLLSPVRGSKDEMDGKGFAEEDQVKKIMLLAVLGLLCVACAVRRPLSSPHRNDTPQHRTAKTVEQCLACHAANMPHPQDRGDCLKCHRILLGG